MSDPQVNNNCYIVDDELHAIEVLEEYISEVITLTLTGKFQNAVEALQQANLHGPDIIFLDIDMPRLNGIDFCRLLTIEAKVVFTTATPDFALKAFEYSAVDYLLKPITAERFFQCVNKILKKTPSRELKSHEFFYIKGQNKNKMIKINYEDVIYIESNDNYILINMIDGSKHQAYLTLTEIALTLPDHLFYRINKSFILNYHRINFIDGNQVVLTDRTVLQIGNTYKKDFLNFINNSLIKRKGDSS